jgi:serine/threonine protein kinase
MGVVYEAFDEHNSQALCAVKVLLESHSSERARQRFDEEIRCVQKLKSPHIVAVYDTGEDEEGHRFVVMERLFGVPLSELLRSPEPLGVERALHIGQAMLEGLSVAHAEGVVHRDLKPANVMVNATPEGDVVKLVDFGIAKDLTREETLNLTRTGMLVGTPTYMSPERFDDELELTAAADLYAIGMLMYHMISGDSPIYARHPALPPEIRRLPAPLQVCWLHVNYTPPLLSDAPAGVASLVASLLAKAPSERPTAHDASTRLRALHEHLFPSSPPTETLPKDLFGALISSPSQTSLNPPPVALSQGLLERSPLEQSSADFERFEYTDVAGPATLRAPPLPPSKPTPFVKPTPPAHPAPPSPVETLMMTPSAMEALNQELNVFAQSLTPQEAPPAAPAPLPTTPSQAHISDVRRHEASTLLLSTQDPELQAKLRELSVERSANAHTPQPTSEITATFNLRELSSWSAPALLILGLSIGLLFTLGYLFLR